MGPMTWWEERLSAKDKFVGGTFLWLSSIGGGAENVTRLGPKVSFSVCPVTWGRIS